MIAVVTSAIVYFAILYHVGVRKNKRVDVETNPDELFREVQDAVAGDSNSALEQDSAAERQITENQRIEETESALRSEPTCTFFLFFLLFKTSYFRLQLTFWCSIIFSLHKGVMIFLTTFANFGTIREVFSLYSSSICSRSS